ncbi:MAG TPA: universal stress protein [Candidatus Aphodousia faecigallinarum]|uniref:Universal stress protein n=1 Tax=Candidatus Aphodousia faecigallinarum TaxID=2840677 RepID=A0A9D1II52_9BURK|nr:universal stress protein [Candidatus Aphodousia faecigallinarum]
MRVIVPVDGGRDCREAIRFIASKKDWYSEEKPEIELVFVQKPVVERTTEQPEFDMSAYYDARAMALWSSMREEIEAIPVEVKKTSLVGHPAQLIPQYANEQKADLVVMGARGLSALQNLYLGSVSLATIASSNCPVLVFRQTTELKSGNLRVGLSVDDSPFGPKCADYLIAHRQFFGKDATFEIINVVPDDPLYAPDFVNEGPVPPQMTWEEIQALEFDASVKTPVERFDIAGVPVKAVKLIGDPEYVLPKYADENLDVMVMGTHGKGALRSLVFGSSTRAMIAATNLPILVVPNV